MSVGPNQAIDEDLEARETGSGVLLWSALTWMVTALFFLFIAVSATFYDRFPADERIANAIQEIDVPVLGGFFAFINMVGNTWLSVTVTVAAIFGFAFLRAGGESTLVFLSLAPRAATAVLKEWVERPRPSEDLVQVTSEASGFSFPSGHTVGTVGLYGMLFFLIPAVVPRGPLRWVLQVGCLLAVLSAGPARVYDGVHWPSDVLGSYLLVLLILTPPLALYYALRRRSTPTVAS